MDERLRIECETDGPLSRSQRAAVRSLRSIGEIVDPLVATAALAQYWKRDAIFAALLLRRAQRDHDAVRIRNAKKRLVESRGYWRACKDNAAGILREMERRPHKEAAE